MQTLVNSAIVQVDAAPFKQWYLQHYGVDIGRKKKTAASKKEGEEVEAVPAEKKSNHVQRKLQKRQQDRKIDPHIEEQFASGRLLAAILSRPGQCGRADRYILEGKELEFYMKKLQRCCLELHLHCFHIMISSGQIRLVVIPVRKKIIIENEIEEGLRRENDFS
ncbi:PREDICTED: 40S ribosomal protein S8-like [Nicotiana attenuata]|uniref:40s ribosomal protein s8 n=1 Tax=Nicotiana attenuata TaxID=49451 RepID=A0A314KZ92_NICAT|nr:PREDICTED: 40S ribosomal protein S8-like [Nicotiana attenuata]OIT34610.1 40s ribosomal protein s8 [Nicotiana attenuata]